MTIDEMNDQIDQLEHDMWVLMTPTTAAKKLLRHSMAPNRSLPEPADATTLLKVSWLLQTPISPFKTLSLQDVLYTILPIDRL